MGFTLATVFGSLSYSQTPWVNNYVPVSAEAQFPMYRQSIFIVGPKTMMTAAHYVMGARPCPGDLDSPVRKGQVFPYPEEGGVAVVGAHYCYTMDLLNKGLKLGPGGFWSDWALIYKPDLKVPADRYLTLDFTPPQKGDDLLIVGMGKPYKYSRKYPLGSGAMKVVGIGIFSALLDQIAGGRHTMPGDSGSPWMRMHADDTVTVVGTHSRGMFVETGDRGFQSGLGLFQSQEDQKVIHHFIEKTGAEICGVNLQCAPIEIPVDRDDLYRDE